MLYLCRHSYRNQSSRFCGQVQPSAFDRLGFTIVGEWRFIGAFKDENMKKLNIGGRFGDFSGHPSEEDLKKLEKKLKQL